MPLAPVASPVARQTVHTAFEELNRTITPQDSRDFHKTTLQDVREAALNIEVQLASRQCLRNMRRLMPLFEGLEHYGKIMSVLCNGTPFLPWVWAPITLILRVACEHVEAFEQIMKGYARIASALKRFEILDQAFSRDADFQNAMAVFYADILEFHKHAYKFVRRNGWKLLFLTSWGRFQRRFDNILEDMERHETLIDLEANARDIAEGRQLRQDIRLWREESVDRIRRLDEEHAAKQYTAIMSWLRADESDQLAVFESISAEGIKHPGTCGWILKTPKVSSWLKKRRETAMLWLQGSPGTGKSVMSAQLINYMKAAKMFVIHHFCTHSYPSSTSYDQILRSLLLQLLRKDGDLVAHVYNECVLERKSPTLSTLEHLLQVLLASLSSEPCQAEHIWLLLDGLDECDADKQARVLSLLNQVASKFSSSDSTICKVLVSSRPTSILAKRLGKKQTLSFTDEKPAVEEAIRQYASQRLHSLHQRFSQLDIGADELGDIEHRVARKADGMFLYARLVLDYLATNIFYNGEEVRTSINHLPNKLTDFYRRILTQILAPLDHRSVERIKCIFGWVAFSKRPLKKLEFLSAVSFSPGDPSITHLAPQYILDICEPLVEERRDGTLAFIHVSVKDFVQTSSSNLVIREEEVVQQNTTAVLACLISGLDVFNEGYPEDLKTSRVIRGLHGLHTYATEFWTEYLLSEASRHGGISSDIKAFRLAIQLTNKLESMAPCNVQRSDSNPSSSDERLLLLGQHETLHKHVERSLKSRTIEQLERELQDNQSDTPQPNSPEGILTMLTAYQQCVRCILGQHDFPGVSAEELELFKRQFHTSAFTCRLKSCPRATMGFDSVQLLQEHEISHVCRPRCDFPGCQYPPFSSAQALRRHEQRFHQQDATPRPIRRVGNFGRSKSTKLLQQMTDREAERKRELGHKRNNITTGDDTLSTRKNDLQTNPGVLSPLLSPPRPPASLPLILGDSGSPSVPRSPERMIQVFREAQARDQAVLSPSEAEWDARVGAQARARAQAYIQAQEAREQAQARIQAALEKAQTHIQTVEESQAQARAHAAREQAQAQAERDAREQAWTQSMWEAWEFKWGAEMHNSE
ncbi:uncharacterized protein B0H64DRAFT_398860 [Chaetomium fimeti]|uniref:NACHT domain-containing protein n=1 Tax=Chaetomium fimeti TaxID=1854472 RepID=A0AAE0LQT8_9PEZI|nr:hypothetical protein B0H64DRAFT_398860 [Chaetomium fimeti]